MVVKNEGCIIRYTCVGGGSVFCQKASWVNWAHPWLCRNPGMFLCLKTFSPSIGVGKSAKIHTMGKGNSWSLAQLFWASICSLVKWEHNSYLNDFVSSGVDLQGNLSVYQTRIFTNWYLGFIVEAIELSPCISYQVSVKMKHGWHVYP